MGEKFKSDNSEQKSLLEVLATWMLMEFYKMIDNELGLNESL